MIFILLIYFNEVVFNIAAFTHVMPVHVGNLWYVLESLQIFVEIFLSAGF